MIETNDFINQLYSISILSICILLFFTFSYIAKIHDLLVELKETKDESRREAKEEKKIKEARKEWKKQEKSEKREFILTSDDDIAGRKKLKKLKNRSNDDVSQKNPFPLSPLSLSSLPPSS